MWWSAVLMGLAGSFHCAGMCGPLVLAVTARRPFLYSKIVYNTGRVLTYATIGAVGGAIGSFASIGIEQNTVSVLMGVILILLGLRVLKKIRIPYLDQKINWAISQFKHYFSRLISLKGNVGLFLLGSLNGILPCGLTYVAFVYCFILPSAKAGFLFMLLFGLGTWPVMIGLTWLVDILLKKSRFSFNQITSAVLVISGMLLIARVLLPAHTLHHPVTNASPSKTNVICK